MSGHADILARHWREARSGRFDARRPAGIAKLAVSVERKALERRLAFVQWARAEWAQQPLQRRAA